jgi:small-conductance mechanosensitive channel
MARDSLTIDVEKSAGDSGLTRPTVIEVSSQTPSIRFSKDGPRPGMLPQQSKFSFNEENVGYDANAGTRDTLGCMYERLWSIRAVLRWLRHFVPVAALLAIPVALFATIYWDYRADGIRLLGLFVWLEVLWGGLWVSKLIAMLMPALYVFVSGVVNSGVRKYHTVVRRIEKGLSVMFWTIIAYASSVPVCTAFETTATPTPEWVYTLRKVCLASIAVAAMILLERLIIQIINISYSEKQFSTRIAESKRRIAMLDALYVQSTTLHPPFCQRFAGDDYTIITGIVEKEDTAPSKLLANVRMAGREVAQAFGQMTSDITGARLFNTQAAHTIVTEALEATTSSEALARRIWSSFVPEGATALTQADLEKAFPPQKLHDADELFALLDVDHNGDVSCEEMIMTVVRMGQERIAIWRSTHDLKSAVRILDRFLSLCVVVGTALVYAAFFSNSFSSYLATVGTQLAAISFAISGTVQEFLGSCIFIFVKHPFDVGDRVRIDGHDLLVERISLLYSVFRTVDTAKTTQVPNITLNNIWVENVSRSGAMRERVTVQVSADTSFEDIERLRASIRDELRRPDNRRDFKDDVDVELVSIGDMSKVELFVEAEHKVCLPVYLSLRSMHANYASSTVELEH